MGAREDLQELQSLLKTLPKGHPDRADLEQVRSQLMVDVHSNPQEQGSGISKPDADVEDFVSDSPSYRSKVAVDKQPVAAPKKPKNTKLPSASGDSELYRPPEHAPQGADPFDYVAWEEPTIEQFRAEMGPRLAEIGDDPNQYDEHTPEFRAYADQKYADAFDRAALNNQVISRSEYITHPGWTEDEGIAERGLGYAAKYATKAKNAAASAAYGALEGIVAPGAADAAATGLGAAAGDAKGALEEERFLKNKHPIANAVGEAAGFLSPLSIPGKAARGFQGLTKGAGLLKRAAGAAMGGAALGGASGALRETSAQGMGQAVGNRDAWNSEDIGKRAMVEGMLGGGLGLGGELGGSGARALRDKGLPPQLRELASKAGFKFGLGGIEPPPKVAGAIGAAEKAQVSPEEVLTRDMRERVSEAGQSFFEQGQPGMKERQFNSYYAPLPQGHPAATEHSVGWQLWEGQDTVSRANQNLEKILTANKDRISSAKPLVQYTQRLMGDRPTMAIPGQAESGGGNAKIEKLKSLGLWKEVAVTPDKLKTEAERLGGIISTNDAGESVILVPKQLSPKGFAKVWNQVHDDPELSKDSLLIEGLADVGDSFGRQIKTGEGKQMSELWDALERIHETKGLPQRQHTAYGKRYQYGRLPNSETVIADGQELKLSREDAAKVFEGKPIQMFDPGMDPKKLERTLDFAKVPTKNGVPIPWQEMTAGEQASLSGQLRSYPNLSLDEQEALETIAKSVPGLPESLMEFRGHRAGLDLMARDKGNDMPFLSLRGTGLGLPGISLNYSPKSMFGRLYNPLNAASNNRTAPLGLTGAASDVTNELMEAQKRKAATKEKR